MWVVLVSGGTAASLFDSLIIFASIFLIVGTILVLGRLFDRLMAY